MEKAPWIFLRNPQSEILGTGVFEVCGTQGVVAFCDSSTWPIDAQCISGGLGSGQAAAVLGVAIPLLAHAKHSGGLLYCWVALNVL